MEVQIVSLAAVRERASPKEQSERASVIQNSIFPLFLTIDALRRSLGSMLDEAGLVRRETPSHVVLRQSNLQLRRYGQQTGNAGAVLIVPAPIKKPYIFDLLPEVSIVRVLTEAGYAVYLTEWCQEASAGGDLDQTVALLRIALEQIVNEAGRPPILIGHSLGGTLAAILAAIEPDRIDKLLLIEAPISFGEHTGALRPIGFVPESWLFGGTKERIPGSVLDVASVAAAPEEFVFARWSDAWASLPDTKALAIHLGVIRWTLDEFAPPIPLLRSITDLLYRRDLFARNELPVLGRLTGSNSLAKISVAAIVDHTSRLIPPASVLEGLRTPSVFAYVPETGVALQHVGPLVGRRAHREIWPRILDWMRSKNSIREKRHDDHHHYRL
jgi:polyhydroxyalkanoate synthase subunit PhaC